LQASGPASLPAGLGRRPSEARAPSAASDETADHQARPSGASGETAGFGKRQGLGLNEVLIYRPKLSILILEQ